MVIRRLEQKVRIENEKSSKIHLESGFDMRISISTVFSIFDNVLLSVSEEFSMQTIFILILKKNAT